VQKDQRSYLSGQMNLSRNVASTLFLPAQSGKKAGTTI
jgi:hypothetical protein